MFALYVIIVYSKKMAKYHGYARVSTKDQSDHSLENQIKYLEIKAQELGLDFIAYKEKESGKSVTNRPKIQELLNNIAEDDYVGFYDNSRLGRDAKESLDTIDAIFLKGVNIQVSGVTYDEDSPRDRLIYTIESAVSEFYRREQNLKSQIGIEQKKKSGEWVFSSFLLGYKLSYQYGKPIVKIVEEEAEIIKYIFNEYAKGKSIRTITKELNSKGYRSRSGKPFHEASIRRYIHKPIYKGYYKIKGAGGHKGQDKVPLRKTNIVKSKYYPPLVSEELWDTVQKSYRTLRRDHTIQYEYRYSYYELTSILKCYHCKQIKKATTYVHSYKKMNGRNNAYDNYVNRLHLRGCKQKYSTFRGWVLESLFRNCFYLVFSDANEIGRFIDKKKNEISESSADIRKDIERIDNQIQNITNEKKNLIDAVQQGLPYEDIQDRITEVNKQLKNLETHRVELESTASIIGEEITNYYKEYSENMLLRYINANSPSKKREIYFELIVSAYVFNEQIVIRYSNSKTFIVSLRKNRGRKIQTDFDIKVCFMNRYQYTVNFNAETDELTIVHVPIKFTISTEEDRNLKEGLIERRRKELRDLSEKIKTLKEVESIKTK